VYVHLPPAPLPLQRIETIDAARDRAKALMQGGLWDEAAYGRSARRDDFRSRLIWGDNKPVMAALLQEFRGQNRICVKVIDVFGVDTTRVIEVHHVG
jgi:hypothetical protein